MKKTRRVVLVLLALLILFGHGSTSFVSAATNGWQKSGSYWYYYSNSVKQTGWKQISGKWYYFGSDGVMRTSWQQISGKWYYFGSDGAMLTGWQKLGNIWYHFEAGGAMQTGWQKISNKWYYFGSGGAMLTGWQQISSKWYYFGSDGAMLTGWQKLGSNWYHFTSGGVMETGWKQIGSSWYFFSSGGAMATGWKQLGGKWYHFGTGGAMETGWQKVGTKWYYLGTDGVMRTGWQYLNGNGYYFDANGAMHTGWLKDGSKWYYMNSSGLRVTGWNWIDSSWCYFNREDEPNMEAELVDAENNIWNWSTVDVPYAVYVGKIPSDSTVYKRITSLESSYPEGMHYTNDDYYDWYLGSRYTPFGGGYGCAGFAFMASDVAFGNLPARMEYNITYDHIHIGDILRVNNDGHSVVVLEKTVDYIIICEANYNSSVHWRRTIMMSDLMKDNYVNYIITRWPAASDSQLEPDNVNDIYTIPTEMMAVRAAS